jgi:hypothetical protein
MFYFYQASRRIFSWIKDDEKEGRSHSYLVKKER